MSEAARKATADIIESHIIKEPGAYRMEEATYHRDPCVGPSLSSGVARLLLDASPLHAWHAHPKLNPDWRPEPTKKHFSLGSACHTLLLGAGSKLQIIDAPDYRTKAAREQRDEAVGRGEVPILVEQYAEASRIVASTRRQLESYLPALVNGGGDAEVVVATDTLTDGWTRCMIDWWSADRATMVDYKTTDGYASAGAFTRQVTRLAYDFQDAFYQRVVEATFPDLAGRLRFLFIVQEVNPPYALSIFEVSEADRSVAARKVDAALSLWSASLATDEWPGYPSTVQRITLPEWHARQWLDRELEEADDAEKLR